MNACRTSTVCQGFALKRYCLNPRLTAAHSATQLPHKARVGTISSRVEHYLEWEDAYPFTEEQIVGWASSSAHAGENGAGDGGQGGDAVGLRVGTPKGCENLYEANACPPYAMAERPLAYDVTLQNPVRANLQQMLLAGLGLQDNSAGPQGR